GGHPRGGAAPLRAQAACDRRDALRGPRRRLPLAVGGPGPPPRDRQASPMGPGSAHARLQPLVRRSGHSAASVTATPDFGRLAADYDRVRPVDENWLEVFELVVREGDLRGRRVLDCGLGTGGLSKALGG